MKRSCVFLCMISVVVLAPITASGLSIDFEATPTVGPAPLAVLFTLEDPEGDAEEYLIDFENDGVFDVEEESPIITPIDHIYADVGTYTAVGRVIGADGPYLDAMIEIEVLGSQPIPDPSMVFLLGSACLVGFAGARKKFKM